MPTNDGLSAPNKATTPATTTPAKATTPATTTAASPAKPPTTTAQAAPVGVKVAPEPRSLMLEQLVAALTVSNALRLQQVDASFKERHIDAAIAYVQNLARAVIDSPAAH
jgi:hypothetical protein